MTQRTVDSIGALFVLMLVTTRPSHGAEITIDLGLCSMPSASVTNCDQPSVTLDNEPLLFSFGFFGEPEAHLVSRQDATWMLSFSSLAVVNPLPSLSLTNMDGTIPGLEEIDPFCALGTCVYTVSIPANTYIHGLHLGPFTGSLEPGKMSFVTRNREHEKGLRVPEPATLSLVTLGLVGLALSRRLRRSK